MVNFGDYLGDFILYKSAWRPGDTVHNVKSPGLSRRVYSTDCVGKELERAGQWYIYKHNPEQVVENAVFDFLWDFNVVHK